MSETEQTGISSGTASQTVPYPRLLVLVMMVATLMQSLDMTIANVALPHMQATLSANADGLSWVLTSYILASAIALPITGWLSDRFGRRRLYLWSVGGFIVSSILCGMAMNLSEMVMFRLLQGISGAFLTPLAQAIIIDITPPDKRGKAMGIYGMGVVVGPIMGPILGGWLTENLNWRWVFFVNVPIGVLAFAGLWFLLPDMRRPARRLDIFGFVLLAIGLVALQLLLDRGQHVDWFNSAEIWIELMVAVSALWMFGVHMLTARNPLYSRELLSDRNLLVGLVLMVVLGMVLTASLTLTPIMLENLFGYPVLDAGFLLASRGIGFVLTMALGGNLMTKIDSRLPIAAGLLVTSAAFWDMTGWSFNTSWTQMALNSVAMGGGMGLLFVPITTMAFATLPEKLRTDGSSILNLTRSLGSSMSISVVIAMLARNTAVSHADLTAHLTPAALGFDPLGHEYATGLGGLGLALLDAEVTRQAMMIAFLDDFYLMMVVTLCAVPLALLIRRPAGNATAMERFSLE